MTRRRRHGPGWVLLELILALTIFVFTAIAVLGAVSQGIAGAERTRDRAKAVDLARSTMARLEAGVGTVQNLSGPAPAWEPETASDASDSGPSDMPPPPSLWEVEIDTLASQFPGLTHVTVTAVKLSAPESDRVVASFALHQLVRLGPDAAERTSAPEALGSGPARSGSVPSAGAGR